MSTPESTPEHPLTSAFATFLKFAHPQLSRDSDDWYLAKAQEFLAIKENQPPMLTQLMEDALMWRLLQRRYIERKTDSSGKPMLFNRFANPRYAPSMLGAARSWALYSGDFDEVTKALALLYGNDTPAVTLGIDFPGGGTVTGRITSSESNMEDVPRVHPPHGGEL